LSTLQSLKGFQRAREKQRSLEEKTKIFEENARIAKLSIDRQLLVQILQEMNHTHEDAIKELKKKIQEENRTHDEATKELKEKIADLEHQINPSSKAEDTPSETPSEPAQEVSDPRQEVSTEVDDDARIDALQERVRTVLQEYKESESNVPPEAPKKKKRTFF
jgi:predicted RNase H-like nuclease (RuvC/YqgF family)